MIKSKLKAVGMMNYMTEREYNIKLEKVKAKNDSKLFKAKLKAERNKYKKKKKLPATSKLVLLGVFLVCIEILIFAQFAMIKLRDISAMYTLIGVPVTLVPVTLGYYWKSKSENTASGITYETTMYELQQGKEIEQNDDVM